jgi:uncharacterized protein YggE
MAFKGDIYMKTIYFCVFFTLICVFMAGCSKETKRQNQSTISVFGIGAVSVQPDIIQMNITLSNVTRTAKMAQEEVSKICGVIET